MRVLVFESLASGHRLVYLKTLLDALAPLGAEVKVAVLEDLKHRKEFELLADSQFAPGITLDPCLRFPPRKPLRRPWHQWRELRQVVERWRPDHVYVPTGDGLSQAVGSLATLGATAIPRSIEAETGLHLFSAAYGAHGLARRAKVNASYWAHRRAPWARVHLVDALAFEWLASHDHELAARASVLPDPIEAPKPMSKSEARQRLQIPVNGRYIGCAGVMSPRKGIHLLLREFAKARLGQTDRLLLAGQFAPEVRAVVDNELADLRGSGRLIIIDRFLSMADLQSALAACDVVCTPYPRHMGIASIVLRAAAANRPVLSSRFGWLGWTTERFGLGSTCDVSAPGALETALVDALEKADSHVFDGRAHRLLAFHHPKNFEAAWTRRLRQRLELPPDPNYHAWDDVLKSHPGVGPAL